MQEDAEEPGTAYLAGQGPPINDEDDPDEYEGEDQPESEDFEEGDDDGAEGETTAGALPTRPSGWLSTREFVGLVINCADAWGVAAPEADAELAWGRSLWVGSPDAEAPEYVYEGAPCCAAGPSRQKRKRDVQEDYEEEEDEEDEDEE